MPDPFDSLADQMDEMLEEISQRHFYHFSTRDAWEPAVNVYETADTFYVCLDLAGMDRDAIDVRADGSRLVIRGARSTPQPPDTEPPLSVHVMEIDSGPFRRSVELPADVDRARITARYREGILWIVLPRRREASP